MTTDQLFIGGAWQQPSSAAVIEVVSPHTEELVASVATAVPEDVDRAVTAARQAFDDGPWPRTSPVERIAVVRSLAALYKERRKEMAQLITTEMGAPISFSKFSQATLPVLLMEALAQAAEKLSWEER